MAKDNVTMPQSMAGLQRFTSDDPARIKIKPMAVLVLVAIVVIAVIFLHLFGSQIFGVSSSFR
jgi:preprotein translocase subunit Sec61beta